MARRAQDTEAQDALFTDEEQASSGYHRFEGGSEDAPDDQDEQGEDEEQPEDDDMSEELFEGGSDEEDVLPDGKQEEDAEALPIELAPTLVVAAVVDEAAEDEELSLAALHLTGGQEVPPPELPQPSSLLPLSSATESCSLPQSWCEASIALP